MHELAATKMVGLVELKYNTISDVCGVSHHRNTRRKFSTEEKIRIVLDGLRGESSVAELIAPNKKT